RLPRMPAQMMSKIAHALLPEPFQGSPEEGQILVPNADFGRVEECFVGPASIRYLGRFGILNVGEADEDRRRFGVVDCAALQACLEAYSVAPPTGEGQLENEAISGKTAGKAFFEAQAFRRHGQIAEPLQAYQLIRSIAEAAAECLVRQP